MQGPQDSRQSSEAHLSPSAVENVIVAPVQYEFDQKIISKQGNVPKGGKYFTSRPPIIRQQFLFEAVLYSVKVRKVLFCIFTERSTLTENSYAE